jgi:predicted negative regulator of RcsB-dependent stress response
MPAKRPRPRIADKRLALHKRVARIRAEIATLKRNRAAVNRSEFLEMSKSLRQVKKNTDDLFEHTQHLATQLTRIAQLQAEVDAIKRALVKAKVMV